MVGLGVNFESAAVFSVGNLQHGPIPQRVVPTRSPKDLTGIVLTTDDDMSGPLERKLGLAAVVIISLSAMLGSGLFVLPALAMLEMGGGSVPVGGVWLAYLLAAVIVLPGAISKSELATAMPTSGGSYVYVEKTFGPLFGTIAGLGLWANFMLKSAFALIGFKAYLWVIEEIIGIAIDIEIAALILLLFIVGINILGVKRIKKVQTPIVLISGAYLLGLCAWAVATMPMDWSAVFSRDSFGSGWESVASTAAFVFVSYAGVTKIAAVGGEIKDPSRNIPNGILLSLLFSTGLYVIVTLVMAASLDPATYMDAHHAGHAREDPVYIFAEAVGGSRVGIIAALLSVATMTSMALAGIMASSRFPYAMAKDKLVPSFLESVHEKYHTPHWAIIVTGLSMAAAITFLPVHDVAELASGFKIMIFIVINGCVIVLRSASRSHSWYAPEWKSPAYPFFQMLGIIGGFVLLFLMGSKALIGGSAAIILGLIIYKAYGENHVDHTITPWETFGLLYVNPEEVETRRRLTAFHAADINGDGELSIDQYLSAMDALGYPADAERELRAVFDEADTDGNGIIDIHEFVASVDRHESED